MILLYMLITQLIFAKAQNALCPKIFTYDEPDEGAANHRVGVINIEFKHDVVGLWVHILFDQKVDVLTNWLGSATTADNTDYIIEDPNFVLQKNTLLFMRFDIGFNRSLPVPAVLQIHTNGKKICPAIERTKQDATPILFFDDDE